MNPFNPESFIGKIAMAWIRSGLMGAGAWFYHQGLLTQDQGSQLGGALAVIFSLGLQAWDQAQHQQKQQAAMLQTLQQAAKERNQQ